MRIAYLSPLNPEKSGICDFSEELLPHLRKYMEIDIFTEKSELTNIEIKKNFPVYHYSLFEEKHKERQYDEIIFQMGNNAKLFSSIYELLLKYPGIVVLHDYALHHFMAEYTLEKGNKQKYLDEMTYNYGVIGQQLAQNYFYHRIRPLWETDSFQYPLNKRVLDHAKGVIVLSQFIKNMIKNINCPVTVVPHHAAAIYNEQETEQLRQNLRRKENIDENTIIFGSFGFFTPSKRIPIILETLAHFKIIHQNFLYYIVGDIPKHIETQLRNLVRRYNLHMYVQFKGYVSLPDFENYMLMTDICFNLRFPIHGESSGSLARLLGMGKAVFVTDIGPFSELPDDVVIKIPLYTRERDYILHYLWSLFKNKKKIREIGNSARNYVKMNSTIEETARKYYDFIRSFNKPMI